MYFYLVVVNIIVIFVVSKDKNNIYITYIQ